MAIPVKPNAEDGILGEDDFNVLFENLDEILEEVDFQISNEITVDNDDFNSLLLSETKEFSFDFEHVGSSPNPNLKRKSCDSSFWEVPFELCSSDEWFNMIMFEEEGSEVTEENNSPVACSTSNPDEVSGSGSGSGFETQKGKRKEMETEESGGVRNGVVLALAAPQFCPWRNKKGVVKKGRKFPFKR